MDKTLIGILVVVAVSLLGGVVYATYLAIRRGLRMLRAIQIAETAVDVARRYGGDAGPVEAVARRLLDLKWQVGFEDAAGVPPTAEAVAEGQREPPAFAVVCEDGSVLIEWYGEDHRLGLSLEADFAQSGWFEASLVRRDANGSGYLRDGLGPFRERLAKLLEEG